MLISLMVLSVLLTSLSSFAGLTTDVPSERVPDYIKAVQIAIGERPLNCVFSIGNKQWNSTQLKDAMQGVQKVVLNSSEEQLVLFFETWENLESVYNFAITTSSDYKSVAKVDFQQRKCEYRTQNINVGTIREPIIVVRKFTDCIVEYAAVCK